MRAQRWDYSPASPIFPCPCWKAGSFPAPFLPVPEPAPPYLAHCTMIKTPRAPHRSPLMVFLSAHIHCTRTPRAPQRPTNNTTKLCHPELCNAPVFAIPLDVCQSGTYTWRGQIRVLVIFRQIARPHPHCHAGIHGPSFRTSNNQSTFTHRYTHLHQCQYQRLPVHPTGILPQ